MTEYKGPPLDICPSCSSNGRGNVTFLPVIIGNNEVMWLCRNWDKCLFPHVYGPEAVRQQTVPVETVDPKLIGYIPMYEGDSRPNEYSLSLLDDKTSTGNVPSSRASVSPSTSSSPTISHCATTSEGSEHDTTQTNSSMPNIVNSSSNITTLSPSPVLVTLTRPRPKQKSVAPKPTNVSSSQQISAPLRPSRKRPRLIESEKNSFPSYVADSSYGTLPKASSSEAASSSLLSMITAQMRKIKRHL